MPLLSAAANAALMPRYLRDAAGKKIPGTNAWKSGLLFGRPGIGLRHGLNNQVKGNLPFILLGMGLAAGTAPRGHAVSAMTRGAAGILGSIAGFAFGGTIGSVIGSELAEGTAGKAIERGVQAIADLGGHAGAGRFGGDFEDSNAAWTMRQVAVQQMASSNLNARRYLGQEAAFFHA